MKKVSWVVVIAGAVVGLAAVVLTHLGNPANMGFCIACFERDIAGAVGLHSAAKVQYVRPEIIGLVLGAFIMSVATKEFRAKAGSSPATRFVLGAFVMIGALAFLGCPLRMVLRIGGGDLNAVVGLVGFTLGIFIGIQFLKRGFSLKRAYPVGKGEGGVLPIVMTGLLILVIAVPSLFKFSEEGPGSKHAPMLAALLIAVVVGLVLYYVLFWTSGGFKLRAVGYNMTASRFNGIHVKRCMLTSFIISGAIAGLGGGAELLGTQFRLINGFGAGYGFDGVAMALIGQLHPIATMVVALFFAVLRVGSTTMQAATGVPTSVSDIIQALVIVFSVAGMALTKLPEFQAWKDRVFSKRKAGDK